MPKDTFFRLPKEKQKRLIEAAGIEFSRVPLQEASIANIVRIADIPRGSFYQYFEDKEDLYYFYFERLRAGSKKDLETYLEDCKGDIFEAFKSYFNKMIEEVLRGPNSAFYKNLFMYMDYHGTYKVSPEIEKEERYHRIKEERKKHPHLYTQSLVELIDHSTLEIEDTSELIGLLRLLFSMSFSSINHAYRQENRGKEVDIEKIKDEFSTKLKWLKYGVYKDKEGGN